MVARFPDAADSLEEAQSLFDWRNHPRMSAGDLQRFYEPRANQEHLRELLQRIRAARRNGTWLHALYIGPPGCGKSTDLTWMVEHLGTDALEPLLTCHYDIGRVVGTHDVGFAEVALSLVLQVYERFEAGDLPQLAHHYLERVHAWLFAESTSVQKQSTTRESGGEASLLKLFKLGLSSRRVREQEVRLRLNRLLPELRALVDELLQEVTRLTGRHLLFVVDDLEKITPVDTALALFLNHGGFFADLPCHLVLTAPSSLRLHQRYNAEVLGHFAEVRATLVRPVREGKKTSEFESLRNVIYRRISPALIAAPLVDHVVAATGGLVAQIVDVMEKSLVLAMAREAKEVRRDCVDDALKELSARYFAALRDDAYGELDRVERLGASAHVERPELLHSLAILEYPDSPSEFVVHPLVANLLERWRRGRET